MDTSNGKKTWRTRLLHGIQKTPRKFRDGIQIAPTKIRSWFNGPSSPGPDRADQAGFPPAAPDDVNEAGQPPHALEEAEQTELPPPASDEDQAGQQAPAPEETPIRETPDGTRRIVRGKRRMLGRQQIPSASSFSAGLLHQADEKVEPQKESLRIDEKPLTSESDATNQRQVSQALDPPRLLEAAMDEPPASDEIPVSGQDIQPPEEQHSLDIQSPEETTVQARIVKIFEQKSSAPPSPSFRPVSHRQVSQAHESSGPLDGQAHHPIGPRDSSKVSDKLQQAQQVIDEVDCENLANFPIPDRPADPLVPENQLLQEPRHETYERKPWRPHWFNFPNEIPDRPSKCATVAPYNPKRKKSKKSALPSVIRSPEEPQTHVEISNRPIVQTPPTNGRPARRCARRSHSYVMLLDLNNKQVRLTMDTQAPRTIIHVNDWKRMGRPALKRTSLALTPSGSEREFKIMGKCMIQVQHGGNRYELPALVGDRREMRSVLGLCWLGSIKTDWNALMKHKCRLSRLNCAGEIESSAVDMSRPLGEDDRASGRTRKKDPLKLSYCVESEDNLLDIPLYTTSPITITPYKNLEKNRRNNFSACRKKEFATVHGKKIKIKGYYTEMIFSGPSRKIALGKTDKYILGSDYIAYSSPWDNYNQIFSNINPRKGDTKTKSLGQKILFPALKLAQLCMKDARPVL